MELRDNAKLRIVYTNSARLLTGETTPNGTTGETTSGTETTTAATGSTSAASMLSESETEQAYAEFYDWCLAQQWGPAAPATCSQQFQAMIDKLRELGLPLAAP